MTAARQLVERFYAEVWNKADETTARTLLHPDVRFRGSLGDEKQGIDGFLDYMRSVHAALAEYTCTVEDLIAAEERVAARVRFEGLHREPFLGFAPTGRHVAWTGAAFFTLRDNRIAKVWVLGDVDALKTQLRPV